MGKGARKSSRAAWTLARNQHGVITRGQLLELGMSSKEIESRTTRGRIHAIHRGVYAVGRPELTLRGWWMAAVLACGDAAVLSHRSAAALWGIQRPSDGSRSGAQLLSPPSLIDVSVPGTTTRRRNGIRAHRRRDFPQQDRTLRDRIPVTSPARTLIDLATQVDTGRLEAAVNEADGLGLIDPETLRRVLDERGGAHGVTALRMLLDRRTFTLTESELERRFLRLVRAAGLPKPLTQVELNGFRVDFYWPELRLVVEADSLRYHRTPSQQTRDRQRDQAHTAAGLTPLRFTHAQVAFEAGRVGEVLRSVAQGQRLLLLGARDA
jgi:very-short-patch-repair endonuclease